MPKNKIKFKFSKKPNGGDLTGSSSTREFKPQQDFSAKALAKRNQTKPDSDAQLTDYGLNKQTGEKAINRGDVNVNTRFGTHSQNSIMDVKGTAGGESNLKRTDKKITIAKYTEGTGSVETSKPKKMGFFKKLKKKQEEGNALAESIDAQDSAPKQEYNITQEKSFVGPKNANLEGRSAEAEYTNAKRNKEGRDAEANYAAGKPSSVTKATPSTSSTTGLAKGGTQAVAEWQKKRGLKADGAWGKDTQAAYEKEQSSKKMKLNKTKPVQNSIKSTSKPEEQVKSSTHKPAYATGQKGKDGNVYFSNGRTYNPKTGEKGTVGDGSVYSDKNKTNRAANADMNAWGNATSKGKSKETKAEQVQRLMDTSANLQAMGDGAAIGRAGVKTAQEIQKGEREDDDRTMSLGSKIGLGAAGLAALGTAVYGYKKGKKRDLVNNLTEAAMDKAKSNKVTTNKLGKLAEANKAIDESYEAPVKKMKLKKAKKTEAPATTTTKSTTSTNSGSTSSTATNSATETYQQKRIRLAEERAANAGNNGKGTQPKAGSRYNTPEEVEYMKAKGTNKRPTAEELKAYSESKGGVAPANSQAAEKEVKATTGTVRGSRGNKTVDTKGTSTTSSEPAKTTTGRRVPPKPTTTKPDAEVQAALNKKAGSKK